MLEQDSEQQSGWISFPISTYGAAGRRKIRFCICGGVNSKKIVWLQMALCERFRSRIIDPNFFFFSLFSVCHSTGRVAQVSKALYPGTFFHRINASSLLVFAPLHPPHFRDTRSFPTSKHPTEKIRDRHCSGARHPLNKHKAHVHHQVGVTEIFPHPLALA